MIHHLEIYVSDLARSVSFWDFLLGRLGYEAYQRWERGRSWRLGGTYLAFVQAPEDGLAAGYDRRRVGLNHLAFHGGRAETVDRLIDELRARGVRVLYEDRYPYAGGEGHYAAFFADPDGIKVELVASDPEAVPSADASLLA